MWSLFLSDKSLWAVCGVWPFLTVPPVPPVPSSLCCHSWWSLMSWPVVFHVLFGYPGQAESSALAPIILSSLNLTNECCMLISKDDSLLCQCNLSLVMISFTVRVWQPWKGADALGNKWPDRFVRSQGADLWILNQMLYDQDVCGFSLGCKLQRQSLFLLNADIAVIKWESDRKGAVVWSVSGGCTWCCGVCAHSMLG